MSSGETDEQKLAIRDQILDGLVMAAGIVERRNTRNPLNIRQGTILSVDEEKVYSFLTK